MIIYLLCSLVCLSVFVGVCKCCCACKVSACVCVCACLGVRGGELRWEQLHMELFLTKLPPPPPPLPPPPPGGGGATV